MQMDAIRTPLIYSHPQCVYAVGPAKKKHSQPSVALDGLPWWLRRQSLPLMQDTRLTNLVGLIS